jgi:hypothetical protein
MVFAAPKLLMPPADRSSLGLLLDLGLLRAETAPPTGDEADVWRISLDDVSASLVPSDWGWGDALPASPPPLLSPTGARAVLSRRDADESADAPLALDLAFGSLAGSLGPTALRSLLALAAQASPLAGADTGPPWARPLHCSPLWLLTRNGNTPGRLVWARRWACLTHDSLYLLDQPPPAKLAATRLSLRGTLSVARLPPAHADGTAFVFALLPPGVTVARATGDSRSTLLRCDDERATEEWVSALRSVHHQRSAAPAALAALERTASLAASATTNSPVAQATTPCAVATA